MIELRGYIDERGKKRFADWIEQLEHVDAAKVTVASARLEQGNLSSVKGVGSGVFEYKIDFGPGYRIYFGKGWREASDSARRWNKKTPAARHRDAIKCWAAYRQRKKQET